MPVVAREISVTRDPRDRNKTRLVTTGGRALVAGLRNFLYLLAPPHLVTHTITACIYPLRGCGFARPYNTLTPLFVCYPCYDVAYVALTHVEGIIQSVEKLQKRCTIKFGEQELRVICTGDVNEGGIQVWSSVHSAHTQPTLR